ncbi:unnamed protein product [Protopolystoma xenopodis]|uniref:Uncharacterized protein n=1 Tax=Protopolystoma xenopodis TaxID=117903 RepID=A0A448XEW5_9PLAT|nr:unnamed protein product [Protopolystoma xenopodis]
MDNMSSSHAVLSWFDSRWGSSRGENTFWEITWLYWYQKEIILLGRGDMNYSHSLSRWYLHGVCFIDYDDDDDGDISEDVYNGGINYADD